MSRPLLAVPDDLNSTLEVYTEQGYRVIAMGRRTLAQTSYTKIQRMRREELEQDLEFLGMIVLENRLKPETEPVIGVLRGAHLKVVMITGKRRWNRSGGAPSSQLPAPRCHASPAATSTRASQTHEGILDDIHYTQPTFTAPLDFVQRSLWSSGQSSWLQTQKSRVRIPELPDFLSSSGSGTGSTQPRQNN
jgi:hypothetical protein